MNLNMSSVTAHALITIIQAIADGGQTIPSAAVHADEGAEATPASTTTPPLSSTTLAPAIGSIAEAIAKLSLCNNADLVGLPPRSVSYKGFPYEIPDLSAEGPFYCVIKGKRVGVLSTWYAFFFWLYLMHLTMNQQGRHFSPSHGGQWCYP